jgi:uncharacterized protein (DUF1330 family)
VKHAQSYFFGEFEVTDPVAYEVYRAKVPDIISTHGGRILVRGGDPQPFDGSMPQRRFVIVEFDSPEAARTFKLCTGLWDTEFLWGFKAANTDIFKDDPGPAELARFSIRCLVCAIHHVMRI